MKTYNDLYIDIRRRLKQNGVEEYQKEARLLICSASEKTKEEFYRDLNLYVAPEFASEVEEKAKRRLSGEPLAQVTGEWEFFGLPITVTGDVLIPRVDTEVLAEAAIDLLRSKEVSGTRVLDLCTGSGCVGVAIAANVPACNMILIDKSLKALAVCQENIRRNNLTRCMIALDADAMAKPPMLIGRFDLLVSNPPYIPSAQVDTLDASVRNYEPRMALDGGEDGLMFYRSIAGQWKTVLKDNGHIMLECGEGQADDVEAILKAEGFTDFVRYQDTIGVDRVVSARIAAPCAIRIGGE